MERMTMTVPEAAAALGIGRNTAYEMANDGRLPTVRFGRRVLVVRHRLLAMLDAATIADSDELAGGSAE